MNVSGLPQGWQMAALDEVCEVIQGQSPPGDTYNDSGAGIPFFQGKAEFGPVYPTVVKWCSSPTKIAELDDILISIRAPVGPTNLCPLQACIGRGLAAIRPLGGIPARYILYALRNSESDLASRGTGSTFAAVSGAELRSHRITLAPLPTQHRIVAEIERQLTRLDAAVAALKRIRANLKRYRASVLKAACEGRLVPTEAELARAEGRDYETGAQLLARILRERRIAWETQVPNVRKRKYDEPQPPDTSRLPELPEGWTWASVEQVGRLQLGRQRAPKYHQGQHMRPYLRVQNVFEARIDLSDVMEMDFPGDDATTYELRSGDILLNEGQSPELLGRPALYRGELPGVCFTNTLIRFQAAGSLCVEFALIVFRHYMRAGRFAAEGTITTNIAHLSLGRLSLIEFPLPPLAEQCRIVAEVERRLSVIQDLEESTGLNLRRADRLQQAILKRAFEGKLVPQDPNDEPASALLERIRAEGTSAKQAAGMKRHGGKTRYRRRGKA